MVAAAGKNLLGSAKPELPASLEVPAAWLNLALHAGEPDYFSWLLALLFQHSGADSGGIWLVVRTATGNGLACKAVRRIPTGNPEWNAWLRKQVLELISSRKASSIPAGAEGEEVPGGPAIFVPLVWEGTAFGVAFLKGAALDLEAAARLGKLAGWAARLEVRQPKTSSTRSDQGCADALLASAHSADWPGVLAAHLQRESGAWRASLLRERGGRWRVAAVSGVGEVKRQSAETRGIEQAFGRLAAAGADAGEAVHRERTAISIRFGKASAWGALLEFAKGAVANEAQVRHGLASLIAVGERVLPQVPEPGWRLSLSRALLDRPRPASPKGSRWALAGFATMLVLAAFFPTPETFDGDCELEPAQRFTVVSEVEGRIQNIAVQEGALVHAGETLAVLDTSTLKTRLEVAREQRQEQEAQARRAQGQQDLTAYRLAKLKAEQSAQEETSLLEDIRRSTIVAPIDGKILTKDLAQKQGTVFRLGDTLCEIGGLNAWNLQISIPEDDLDPFLQALKRRGKLPVAYRLKAGSTFALQGEVTSGRQISEMAYPVEGRNVIYITVPGVTIPEELQRDLRPGFSGRAKISGRARPWGLILTRRLTQYLQLHWWLR